jgi:hypothetical protein
MTYLFKTEAIMAMMTIKEKMKALGWWDDEEVDPADVPSRVIVEMTIEAHERMSIREIMDSLGWWDDSDE